MGEQQKSLEEMIAEIYSKLINKPKTEVKPQRLSLRQFFIHSYVKESIFQEFTPFKLERGSINDIANLAAQVTFKMLTPDQKQAVENQYNAMTNEQLEHLKNM